MRTHIIVGCGGGGSWLAHKLARYDQTSDIILIDGDTLEEGNLDRQFFDKEDVGRSKSAALCDDISFNTDRLCHLPVYYFDGILDDETVDCCLPSDWNDTYFWGCADNHAARRNILQTCDRKGCYATIAGNELYDAEAYFYDPAWQGGKNDPRIFYPEIATSDDGNPLRPDGCAGPAAEKTPQLLIANVIAVDLAMSLYYFWTEHRKQFPEDTASSWPVHLKWNPLRVHTIKKGDRQ